MLYEKQIPSPARNVKWTRAAVDHLLSNSKYIAVVGFQPFTEVRHVAEKSSVPQGKDQDMNFKSLLRFNFLKDRNIHLNLGTYGQKIIISSAALSRWLLLLIQKISQIPKRRSGGMI